MAHLNMRDRLIETTIAYVGSDGGSGAVNFEHVRRNLDRGRPGSFNETAVEGGRVLSLDWRPRDGKTLNDCELTVKLVSAEGAVENDAMHRVLVDADGLVLMLDADPDADARNQRALATVREVLARTPEKKVPVVVQVNQHEGSDAQPNFDSLVLDAWPRISARAVKGDGIMETLQRAVDGVVESMQKAQAPDAAPVRAGGGVRAEGNPLLGALRQMLQSTVTEQLVALEARILDRLETQRSTYETVDRAMTTRVASLDARMDRIEAAIVDMGERTADFSEPGATVADLERVGTRLHETTQATAGAVTERITSFDARMKRVESVVVELGERIAAMATTAGAGSADLASKADLAKLESRLGSGATTQHEAVLAEVKEHRRAMRDEVARAVATPTQALGRAVDALASEVKRSSAKEPHADLAGAIERFEKKTEGLAEQVDALLSEWREAESRLDELAPKLMQADTQTLRRIVEVRDMLRVVGEQSDVRSQALQTGLVELIEELQKKKKSWFT